ncbi:hypothetical protein [Cohnella zeiphila]|uniref:Uncharacterized protein n=1 Tax=Cohnella zeiphila TaxID=2761120 RepID=A0A7X0SNB4_9BACL|nr:hypothetical protein [Cohnella zeiphila]MBB6733172.1 hypothetical protein [Cohnella zeiphila]
MEQMRVYDNELVQVFKEAESIVASFPAPLALYGHQLLRRINPQSEAGRSNMLFGLLPFWLRERWGGSLDLCRDLAVGNVCATLHFSLVDDAMDRGPDNGPGTRLSLALGQLCQEAFRERYGRHFPDRSPLWERYRAYVADWASYVSQEGSRLRADPREPAKLAAKSAPLKVSAAAILLATGQEKELLELEEAMDLALAVLQLADDWADWKDDLAEESSNAFLVLVREKLHLPDGQALTERAVKQAIFHHGALDALGEIVDGYVTRLRNNDTAPNLLVSFTVGIAEGIREDARRAAETVDRLAIGGGWSYFLSNFS